MSSLRQFLYRLLGTLGKRKGEAELSEELRQHLEILVERNLAAGMSPDEARYAARRSFGGVEQIKERARDERGLPWLEQSLADIRYALRQLRKAPGFALVAVLSLALGIGANTAVFSLIKGVLLAQLPVKNPEQLVLFNWLAEENVGPPASSGSTTRQPGSSLISSTSFSVQTFEAFRAQAPTLTALFAFSPIGDLNVIAEGSAEMARGQIASGDYHLGLGVNAAAGRLFTLDDDKPGAESVAVISYRYWQRRFGGEGSAIGKVITVNQTPVTIIGVTAPAFKGALQVGETIDITLPFAVASRIGRVGEPDPDFWWVRIMGRMKPGTTLEQTRASLEGVFRESARGHVRVRTLPGAPAVDPANIPLPELRAEPGGQGLYETRRAIEKSLRLLMSVVGLVLLVACVNVADLLLARGAMRRREIAVRLALGASRARLVRQLLAESILLAALGAAAGLVVSVWSTQALLALQPFGPNSRQFDTSPDWRVLGFTSAVALATGIVFGLAPALRATRLNLTEEFQGGVRSLGLGSRSRLAKSLMVVQVALSLVLLIGAGLFVRTLRNLQSVDLGFNREGLLIFGLDASAGQRRPPPGALAALDRVRERLAALPGVRRATYAVVDPLSGSNWIDTVYVSGYVQTAVDDSVRMNAVDSSYLATLEIPVLRGRDFDDRDYRTGAPKVAIVNQTFAKKYFGTEDVIGRRFGTGRPKNNPPPDIEIVGLMHDAKYSAVKDAVPPVAMITYVASGFPGSAQFIVRFTGSEAAVAAAARLAVREVDPNLPLTDVRTQVEQIDRLFGQERLFAYLCSVFGVLALGLAAIGLYGLTSYAVLRRTGEIGVRMALGALPGKVLGMILRESLALVAFGVVLGIGAALGASRWVANMLFGLLPNDPITYVAVALLLLSVAFLACLLPARRASKVDPMVALRCE